MAFDAQAWERPLEGLRVVRRGDAQTLRIQIFGQRCSGTNALARLLQTNLGKDVLTEAYGFKHWFVPDQTLFHDDVLVLIIARNAFDWLRSLHRQPWHAHPELKALAFGDFIRAPWHSYWDGEFGGIGKTHPMRGSEMRHERDPTTGERFVNPIAKRTAKLAHWSDLSGRAHNVALLSHETLEGSAEQIVSKLAELTGRRPQAEFQPVWSYKGNGNRRYEPTRYQPFMSADLQWVEEQLDAEIEERFCLPTTWTARKAAGGSRSSEGENVSTERAAYV